MVKIESLDDARVSGFRNLRERELRRDGFFIAEGALLAQRLLASRFGVESLLLTTENAPRFAALLGASGREAVPIYEQA